MQKQHFHKASLISLFWNEEKNLNKTLREQTVLSFNWELYIKKYIKLKIENNNKKKLSINSFFQNYSSENIMYSYLIFKETEEKMNVSTIENNFETLCQNLLDYEKENPGNILTYICNSEETFKVFQYLCLQIARNPKNYPLYLNHYFQNKILTGLNFNKTQLNNLKNSHEKIISYTAINNNKINKTLENINIFNMLNPHNFENVLQIMNQSIEQNFKNCMIFFYHSKKYAFKIIENKNLSNLLTDSTVISLNNNDYFRILLKDDYDNVKDIINNTLLISINQRYLLMFYPVIFSQQIDKYLALFLNHQLSIYFFYSRLFVLHKNQQHIICKYVADFTNNFLNDKENLFIRYYIKENFFLSSFESKLSEYYELHKLGINFGWNEIKNK